MELKNIYVLVFLWSSVLTFWRRNFLFYFSTPVHKMW
jgi:hypothetical protein